jgi:ABC-type lipoprotein export system ATPase subunit
VSAVAVRDLFRVYRTAEGDAPALQGVTLDVREGEMVALIGPSGSGKSTLVRVLAGLERPSAGTAEVLGSDLGRMPERRAAGFRAARLGLVDQDAERGLPPDLPVADGVGLQLSLLGASRPEVRARALELLERVGLAEAAGARPGELSGGERQRVAVCAALVHRPGLVLADEPTAELDAASAAEVHRLLRELSREAGATVVLVSHDPASAEAADRTLRIADGRLAEERAGGATRLVVGRGGWLQLPEELRRGAGVGGQVVAEGHPEGVLLRPAGRAPEAAPAERPTARPASPGARAVAELTGVRRLVGSGRRERLVLDGLSAGIPPAGLTAVTGRSGSGKTTLLRLLAGLDRPDAGRVVVLGRDLGELDREGLAAFRRDHVALVAQDVGLVPFLSSLENVALGLGLRGRRGPDADAAARAWLVRLGLLERLRQRVERLSAGERQRVALARALAPAPELVLLDEPTSKLDRANAAAVARELAEIARGGTAIVCATHDPLVIAQADLEIQLGGGPLPPAAA